MKTAIKDNKQLLDLVSDFGGFIKKYNWIPRYDIETDAFSATKQRLSDDARIKYFDDEVAFYVTKDNKVEGVFIEYFKSNFMEHHKDSKGVLANIEKKKTKEKSLVELSFAKIKKISPDLQEAIKNSLAGRLKFEPLV